MNFNTKSVIAAGAAAALATTAAVAPVANAAPGSVVTEGSSFFGWINSDFEVTVQDGQAVGLDTDERAALIRALETGALDVTVVNQDGVTVDLEDVVELDGAELVWTTDGTYTFTGLELYIDGSATEEPIGSSNAGDVDIDPEVAEQQCINAALSVAIPAALLVPLTLASQVDIPGLSPVANEIRQSIQDANTQLQQGAGIFSDEAAAQAEEFNLAIAGVDYNLAEALAGAAAILAGIGGAYYLLDQCGPMTGSSLDGGGSSIWGGAEENTPNDETPAEGDNAEAPAAS